MDKIPKDLVIDILRRLDSEDVARCRVASKTIFDDAFRNLRSIKLTVKMIEPDSKNIFKKNLLNLISNMGVVESICIDYPNSWSNIGNPDIYAVTDEVLLKEWLPKVSENLKSLSLTEFMGLYSSRNVLQLVCTYCHKLVELKLNQARLSVDPFNPMLTLTSLTLESMHLYDDNITKLNMGVPNLQVLNLVSVRGLIDPKIHLLNLKNGYITLSDGGTHTLQSLSLITPKLIILKLKRIRASKLYVEAPMLFQFHMTHSNRDAFSLKNFENLKHFSIKTTPDISSLLYNLTTTESVEDLTVDASYWSGSIWLRFTLEELFTIFPKVTSLCIKSFAWKQLKFKLDNPESSSKITDGINGLKTLTAYFEKNYLHCLWHIPRVLDQCTGLSQVSFFINKDIYDINYGLEEIVALCVAHCPRLNWSRRMWNGGTWKIVQGL